ncbi:hypothetical protein SAMN02982931_04807 [Bauldia litoralis]|uniref:Uncharacterized protein n=1 Tax=Bauldia litoralis TaxID=665467 RepID=A0A1G6EQD2_9HYPH|nr:hypothetical protein SAMN02982931_04807 [Bauldia litoralis]
MSVLVLPGHIDVNHPVDRWSPPEPPAGHSLTAGALDRWLEHAEPSDCVAYHRGFLPLDRGSGNCLGEEAGQELERVASAAMSMSEAGQAHLIQRRHGAGDYSYLIVARSRPALFTRSRKAREYAS